jgi:site-specific DNA recombinase
MKPHVRPATGGLRAVLYLRQSTSREESISLELQETAGRDYCERQGYTVTAVEADPGISGRTWKRAGVLRVMTMIETGQADVIVLWKWSRLSRSRLDWAVAADKVQTAGGRIESATEAIDTATSTGRLARGMMTEFAAFESERIGDVWRESHARRIKNGLPANGKPRFGYEYTREGGFTPDPVSGPILADIYRRYVAGASIYALVLELNQGPTRPVEGYGRSIDGLWSDRTLRRVMDSGFAAGFISYKGERLDGAHRALITPELWEAYQEARERRRTYRRAERSEYLLSGLVRCACGSPMNAGQYGTNRAAKYRCKAAHEKRTHAGGYVTATFVEEYVHAWLIERQNQMQSEIQAEAKRRPKMRAVVDPSARLRSQIAAVDTKIESLTLRLVDSAIPRETYKKILAEFSGEKSRLESALRSVNVKTRNRPVDVIPSLLDNWERLGIPERREILRALIDYVEVAPGRPRATMIVHPRE